MTSKSRPAQVPVRVKARLVGGPLNQTEVDIDDIKEKKLLLAGDGDPQPIWTYVQVPYRFWPPALTYIYESEVKLAMLYQDESLDTYLLAHGDLLEKARIKARHDLQRRLDQRLWTMPPVSPITRRERLDDNPRNPVFRTAAVWLTKAAT